MKLDVKSMPYDGVNYKKLNPLPLHDLLSLDEINSREIRNTSLTYRYAIKPWLQSKLAPLGILVAIERSDNKKIVFRCRHRGVLKEHQKDAELDGLDGKEVGEDKSDKRYNECCFKIRANYSKKVGKWNISIVNDQHNHPLYPNKLFINNHTPIDLSHTRISQFESQNHDAAAAAAAAVNASHHSVNSDVGGAGVFTILTPPNYTLMASQLYNSNIQERDPNDLNHTLASLNGPEMSDLNASQYKEEQIDDKITVKDKADELNSLVNGVILDKIVKKSGGDVRKFSEEEKRELLSDVIDNVKKSLTKEKLI